MTTRLVNLQGSQPMSLLNGTGSTIAKGLVVKKTAASDDKMSLPAAGTDPPMGVTMNAVANAAWGDIQDIGIAECVSAAAVTAGAEVTFNNAGKVLDWTAAGGLKVLGIAQNATTGADQQVFVKLRIGHGLS